MMRARQGRRYLVVLGGLGALVLLTECGDSTPVSLFGDAAPDTASADSTLPPDGSSPSIDATVPPPVDAPVLFDALGVDTTEAAPTTGPQCGATTCMLGQYCVIPCCGNGGGGPDACTPPPPTCVDVTPACASLSDCSCFQGPNLCHSPLVCIASSNDPRVIPCLC